MGLDHDFYECGSCKGTGKIKNYLVPRTMKIIATEETQHYPDISTGIPECDANKPAQTKYTVLCECGTITELFDRNLVCRECKQWHRVW